MTPADVSAFEHCTSYDEVTGCDCWVVLPATRAPYRLKARLLRINAHFHLSNGVVLKAR